MNKTQLMIRAGLDPADKDAYSKSQLKEMIQRDAEIKSKDTSFGFSLVFMIIIPLLGTAYALAQ